MKKERHFPWPLVWAAEWGAMLLCCALCVVYALFVGTLPTGGSCAVAFLAGLLGGAAGVEKNRRKK